MGLDSRAQVSAVFLAIILGVTTLFIGLFMLATIEPLFDGRVYACSYSNAAGSPQIQLNGSVNITGTQSYTISNLQGSCALYVNVTNISAGAGTVQVRTNGTTTILSTITVPAGSSLTDVGNVTSAATGTYVGNFTHIGSELANITTGSYLRCCSTLSPRATPAGTIYPVLIPLIGTLFTVFGLILIIVGIAAALAPLKKMF